MQTDHENAIVDASMRLQDAIRDLLEATYAHNRSNRRISPIPAYRDAVERAEKLAGDTLYNSKYFLQAQAARET